MSKQNNDMPRNLPKGVPAVRKFNGKVLTRTLKLLWQSYPKLLPLTLLCIVFSSIVVSELRKLTEGC